MFGLFKTKRNNDLLLLSEALAETRSELNKLRNEYYALHLAHEELKENFEELEIPEQIDEYELTEQIERVIRDEAWDYCEPEAERMLENALNEYTTSEDLQHEFEQRETQHTAEIARLTAFTFALIEELNLTHKVTELEERSQEIVEVLLNTPGTDEL